MKLSDADQAKVDELAPAMRSAYLAYRAALAAEGIRAKITTAYRSPTVQAQKLAEGRSTLKFGWHQLRRAVDEILIDPVSGAWDLAARRIGVYLKRARIAEVHGFRQIGFDGEGNKRFIKGPKGPIWDVFHIEYRHPYASLALAIATEKSAAEGAVPSTAMSEADTPEIV